MTASEVREPRVSSPFIEATGVILAVAILVSVIPTGSSQETKKGPMKATQEVKKVISKLHAAYAAFNRGDFDVAVASLDTRIEWTEPAEFPGGGTYHGREAVKEYLRQSRAGWTEGSSEPERFIVSDSRIVVFVHARFRLKGANEWREIRLADVYTVRNGKIVAMNAFADRQQALHWAGAELPKME